MNSILVTGATGFLGRRLVHRLATEGYRVHAMYRSEERIRGWEHPNMRFVRATIGDLESIERAMEGCSRVYHLAAYARAWNRNPRVYYDENVRGTVNLLESARRQGVEKLVFTSTAGVLGPSNGSVNTEDKKFRGKLFTHYDRSKAMAEQKVLEYVERGLPGLIVSPTRIYGPGELGQSNSLTQVIKRYLEGRWRLMPGDGSSIGNYVYIDDAVDCLMLAMEKGKPGELYLAGGENLSFNEMFEILARTSGIRRKIYKLPLGAIMMAARAIMPAAYLTGRTPPFTPSFVRRNRCNWSVSVEKARRELGYRPMSFEEGLKKTIEWIRSVNTP